MYWTNWTGKFLLILALFLPTAVLPAPEPLTPRVDRSQGGDFTLISPMGPVSLQEYRGQVVLMFFGFTSCPDICPIALSVISRVLKQLEPTEREQVRGLFVSLDPERDTVPVLKKYTGYFHPNIVGATNRIEVIRQVADKYGIKFEKKIQESSPIGYIIRHPPDILVVNQQGELLESRIKPGHGAEDITVLVRQLLGTDS